MLLILPGVLGCFMRTQWATSKGEERWERGKEEEQETFALSHSSHLGRLFTFRTLLVSPDSLFSGAPASGSFFQPGFQFNSSSQRGQVYPCYSSKHRVLCLCNSYCSLVFHSPVCPLYSRAGTHTHTHIHTHGMWAPQRQRPVLSSLSTPQEFNFCLSPGKLFNLPVSLGQRHMMTRSKLTETNAQLSVAWNR